MNNTRFRTLEGLTLPRSKTSLHHVFWEARNYAPGEEQRFRNMPGLVLRLANVYHNDLHAETFPPPKPSRHLREQIAEFTCGVYESDVYDQFNRIVMFIGDIANSSWSPEKADEAFRIHENLVSQQKYVELGAVHELRATA